MKRSLIHRGFFREMFRQLRTKGLVGTFILMGLNLIIFSILITSDPVNRTMFHYDARLMAAPMLLFLYIISPIMVLGAYRWQNKRVLSDFYHAIPLTRIQTYASTTAAILLWIGIALGSYAVVNVILFTVFGLPINYLLFLCVFLNMLFAALEIVAAFSIGSALCGRGFAAFFQSVVVLFLPRVLLTVFWMLVEGDSGIYTPLSMLPFFLNPAFNIAATPLHSLIYGIDFANVPAMLYSLAYGAALLALGGIAFRRRKSELAENPYASKFLQTVTRIFLGLPQLAVVTVLFNLRVMDNSYLGDIFTGYAILPMTVSAIFFSFIFYCLYELISVRKWKAVVKGMPFYGICILLVLIYIFVPNWIADSRKRPSVDAEDIKSYRFSDESSLLNPSGIEGADTYPDYLMKRHTFRDVKGKALIASQSKKVNQADSYNYAIVNDGGLFRKVVVLAASSFSAADSETVNKKVKKTCMNDEAFAEKVLSYPKGMIWYSCDGLTAAQAKEVGKLFREDFEKLTPSQRESLILSRNEVVTLSESTSTVNLAIELYGCIGTSNYTMTYWINELTPNAAKAMLGYLNERYEKDMREALKSFINWMEHPKQVEYYDLGSVSIGSEPIYNYNLWGYKNQEKYATPMDASPAEYQILKALSEAPLSSDPDRCVTVRLKNYNYSGMLYSRPIPSFTVGFEADDALMNMIRQWMQDHNVNDDDIVAYDGV